MANPSGWARTAASRRGLAPLSRARTRLWVRDFLKTGGAFPSVEGLCVLRSLSPVRRTDRPQCGMPGCPLRDVSGPSTSPTVEGAPGSALSHSPEHIRAPRSLPLQISVVPVDRTPARQPHCLPRLRRREELEVQGAEQHRINPWHGDGFGRVVKGRDSRQHNSFG